MNACQCQIWTFLYLLCQPDKCLRINPELITTRKPDENRELHLIFLCECPQDLRMFFRFDRVDSGALAVRQDAFHGFVGLVNPGYHNLLRCDFCLYADLIFARGADFQPVNHVCHIRNQKWIRFYCKTKSGALRQQTAKQPDSRFHFPHIEDVGRRSICRRSNS